MAGSEQLETNSHNGRLCAVWLALVLLVLLLTASASAQGLPEKIRGYKVHSDKIIVSTASTSDNPADASVTIGEPKLADAALDGITFELPAEILSAKQSGK